MTPELMDRPTAASESKVRPAPDDMRAFLGRTEPFLRLSPQDLASTVDLARVEEFPAGTYVYSEGDSVVDLWVVMKGRVEVLKYAADGRPRGVETVCPGQLFGSIYDHDDDKRIHSNSAVASVDSTIVRVPFSTFIFLSHRSLGFVTGLCTLYSRRIGEIEARMSGSGDPVAKRLARTLIELSQQLGKKIPITRREIAEFAGTTVETSIRTLRMFEKKRWISSARGQIALLNVPDLKAFCE